VNLELGGDEDFAELDKLTSTVIRYGGTLTPSNRILLDKISPHLAKRILGENNLPV
jgi:hypothetical protein